MQLFKCFVTSGNQKYSFILKANSKEEVKDKLHKEGYSILSIKEINNIENDSKIKFYFKAKKNGETKTGAVLAKDIFKVYFKLRDGLNYEIEELYSEEDKNLSKEKKNDILKKMEEQYELYLKLNRKHKKVVKEVIKKEEKNNSKENYNDFFMNKKLKEIHFIIADILNLLQKFLDKKVLKNLTFDQISSLEENYNNIIKIKGSTNIVKLKQIGEKTLEKLGKFLVKEIDFLEEKNNLTKQEYLNNLKQELNYINKLLKKVGSKKVLREKSRDLKYIIKNLFSSFSIKVDKKNVENIKKQKYKQENIIDETSNSYTKTLLLIEKYKQKQKENNFKILKNFYLFIIPEFILLKFHNNKKIKEILEKRDNLSLRKEVINQNLKILKAKINKNSLFVLKIKKFFNTFFDYISDFFKNISRYAFFLVFTFSLLFIFFNIFSFLGVKKFDLNYKGLFYFIVFSIFLFLIRSIEKKLSKGFKGFLMIFFNILIFLFLIVFGTINF